MYNNPAIARLEMLANRMDNAAARGDRAARDWSNELRSALIELRQQPYAPPERTGEEAQFALIVAGSGSSGSRADWGIQGDMPVRLSDPSPLSASCICKP